jgi:hypothetical protein
MHTSTRLCEKHGPGDNLSLRTRHTQIMGKRHEKLYSTCTTKKKKVEYRHYPCASQGSIIHLKETLPYIFNPEKSSIFPFLYGQPQPLSLRSLSSPHFPLPCLFIMNFTKAYITKTFLYPVSSKWTSQRLISLKSWRLLESDVTLWFNMFAAFVIVR